MFCEHYLGELESSGGSVWESNPFLGETGADVGRVRPRTTGCFGDCRRMGWARLGGSSRTVPAQHTVLALADAKAPNGPWRRYYRAI